MDDMMAKINEVLSDKESMEQMRQLAGMLGLDGQSGGAEAQPPPPPSDMPFDMDTFIQLQCLMQSVSASDKNSDLLLALRPHLSPERCVKLDKSLKLMRAFTLFTAVRNSGLLDKLELF